MAKESKIKSYLTAGLRDYGASVFCGQATRYGGKGWPDRFISGNQWQGWVEFKDFDTRLEPLQIRIIGHLNANSPGSAFVLRAAEGGKWYTIQWTDFAIADSGVAQSLIGNSWVDGRNLLDLLFETKKELLKNV